MAEYIERSDAADFFEKSKQTMWHKDDITATISSKKNISVADVVEVKYGKWEIKSDDYDCEYMMCSCCKEEFYPVDADTVDTTPNYCPNCGAKMDGERRSDNGRIV
jgi:hypothetical protein